jgi:hypothetical protein
VKVIPATYYATKSKALPATTALDRNSNRTPVGGVDGIELVEAGIGQPAREIFRSPLFKISYALRHVLVHVTPARENFAKFQIT